MSTIWQKSVKVMGRACLIEPPGVLHTEPGGPVSLAAKEDSAPADTRSTAIQYTLLHWDMCNKHLSCPTHSVDTASQAGMDQ